LLACPFGASPVLGVRLQTDPDLHFFIFCHDFLIVLLLLLFFLFLNYFPTNLSGVDRVSSYLDSEPDPFSVL
jgi:hypothetical protein